MFIWGWGGDVDPTTMLQLLITDQFDGTNEPRYSNPEYDELVARQATLLDPAERQAVVFEAQKIAWRDSPMVILSYDSDIQAWRTDQVEGFVPVSEGPVFYANTNVNYLSASPIKKAAAGASSAVLAAAAAAAVLILAVVLLARRRKGAKKTDWSEGR